MYKKTLILDSSQIDAFLTCPQLWEYGYKDRLAPISAAKTSEAMAMGTLGHKFLEIYYKERARKVTQDEAIEKALAFEPEAEERCSLCDASREEHELIPEDKHIFQPKPFPLEKPKRAFVAQRFREYCYTYSQKDIVPISSDHVEVGFSYKLYEDDECLYVLEGRMDLLGQYGDNPIWMDHKFQLRSRDLYKKSIQFRNYAMVARETAGITMGMVNYIRMTKEITKDTLKREMITFSKPELDYWKYNLIDIFHEIAKAVGDNKYEKNYSSCSGKFGYPCDFTPLCEEYVPGIIEAKRNTLYTIKKEWKPW